MNNIEKYFTDLGQTKISLQEITEIKRSWKDFLNPKPPKTRVSIFFKNHPVDGYGKEGIDVGEDLIDFEILSNKLRNAIHKLRSDNFMVDSIIVYYKKYIRSTYDNNKGELKTFNFDITNRIDKITYITQIGNYGYYLKPDFEIQIDIINKFDDNIIDLFQDCMADEFNMTRVDIPNVPREWSGPDDVLIIIKPMSWTSFNGKIQATVNSDFNKQFEFNLKNDFGPKVLKFGWTMNYKTERFKNDIIRYMIEFNL